jgi:uncharacterized protein YbjT (DUF2867 family)
MTTPRARPRVLLVGGSGGLAGRAVLPAFAPAWTVRSVHRHPAPQEQARGVEWIRADVAEVPDWTPLLEGVDVVVSLAWYRSGRERRFRSLAEGLSRLIRASESAGVRRWVQLSVPSAPAELESGLPYLRWKRSVDRALVESRLSYAVVRASMLFGPRDKLLTVMLRTIARYHRFPMFGDGEYHVSPIAAADVARILLREAEGTVSHVVDAGGPTRWRYRDLTDRMFAALRREPRYLRFTPAGGRRLARLLETFGSSLLYSYEVTWLLSDLLAPPAYTGLDSPMAEVGPFLDREAARYRHPAAGSSSASDARPNS